jgi:hypothetical protein
VPDPRENLGRTVDFQNLVVTAIRDTNVPERIDSDIRGTGESVLGREDAIIFRISAAGSQPVRHTCQTENRNAQMRVRINSTDTLRLRRSRPRRIRSHDRKFTNCDNANPAGENRLFSRVPGSQGFAGFSLLTLISAAVKESAKTS